MMTFQIQSLSNDDFAALFTMSDDALRAHKAVRQTVTEHPGFPCRVSLADAAVGEQVILVNHASLTGPTPYAATHAVFVRDGATPANLPAGHVPDMLTRRTLSMRPLDAAGMILDGQIVEGPDFAASLTAAFSDPNVVQIHVHFAGRGCFAASVTRAKAPATP